MNVIENFAALSEKEQLEFAEALVKTINSENIFTADTDFEIIDVVADEFSGGLQINVNSVSTIEVSREATWTCETEYDAEDDPGYGADYEQTIYEDVKKTFKTLSTEIDGYTITIEDVDVGDEKTVEVESKTVTQEDDGIGGYEHFGFTGNDSRPYVAVEGTIVKECEVSLTFFVEPTTEAIDITPDEE